MQIMIRPLTAHDKENWRELWRGYQAYYEADLRAGEEALFSRLMSPGKDGPFAFVAVDENDNLVGFTHYLFHIDTWSQNPRCYLKDLFTLEASRGQGVGRALIEAVYAAADERQADQTYWLTQDFNKAGRRLYDKVARLTPFVKYMR